MLWKSKRSTRAKNWREISIYKRVKGNTIDLYFSYNVAEQIANKDTKNCQDSHDKNCDDYDYQTILQESLAPFI